MGLKKLHPRKGTQLWKFGVDQKNFTMFNRYPGHLHYLIILFPFTLTSTFRMPFPLLLILLFLLSFRREKGSSGEWKRNLRESRRKVGVGKGEKKEK